MSSGKENIQTVPRSDPLIQPISDNEFALFQAMIQRVSGIYLSQAKKALLVARLSRRLRVLGLKSFGAYYRALGEEGGHEELARMVDCICTNETSFFREPRQFSFLEQTVIPEIKGAAASRVRPKKVRVWSAACSTGEEPYSLAMTLLSHLSPRDGWEIEILATDISARALSAACEGIWPLERASGIAPADLRAYMLRGTRSQQGNMKAGKAIRSIVHFERMNLHDDVYPENGLFDAIFCRNVLIYFDVASKTRVIDRLLSRLASTGYLFLGHAESLSGFASPVRSVGPTVYAHSQKKADRE